MMYYVDQCVSIRNVISRYVSFIVIYKGYSVRWIIRLMIYFDGKFAMPKMILSVLQQYNTVEFLRVRYYRGTSRKSNCFGGKLEWKKFCIQILIETIVVILSRLVCILCKRYATYSDQHQYFRLDLLKIYVVVSMNNSLNLQSKI